MPRGNTWTVDKIQAGLDRFFKENGKYPTATEFEDCAYLPTARQMQRRFGGMVNLRELLGLKGPLDFSCGDPSSLRASIIAARAHTEEKKIYGYLVSKFGFSFVHREFLFDEDRRVRTDFYVLTKEGDFAVDVFYPKDRHNLIGCLNLKLKTYRPDALKGYPVIFLMLNEAIEKDIGDVLLKRKKSLEANQKLMGPNEFESFCQSRSAWRQI